MNLVSTATALLAGLLLACISLEAGAAPTPNQDPATDVFVPPQLEAPSLASDADEVDSRIVAGDAKREVQRALRILEAFIGDTSHAVSNYVTSVESAVTPFKERKLDVGSLQFLTASLSAARRSLEIELDDVRTWRRFASLVDPDATLLPVPDRFITTVCVTERPLERLSEAEGEVWLRES